MKNPINQLVLSCKQLMFIYEDKGNEYSMNNKPTLNQKVSALCQTSTQFNHGTPEMCQEAEEKCQRASVFCQRPIVFSQNEAEMLSGWSLN